MYFPKPAINENDLAIIERGDTASNSIEAGQYVSWNGKLGKAVSAILQGATLDDSLFDYETDGVINELNNNFQPKFSTKSISGTTDGDGMISLGLNYQNAVPVAFNYSGVTSNTSGYFFSMYNGNWYVTIVNKSIAKYSSVSISGTLYYIDLTE